MTSDSPWVQDAAPVIEQHRMIRIGDSRIRCSCDLPKPAMRRFTRIEFAVHVAAVLQQTLQITTQSTFDPDYPEIATEYRHVSGWKGTNDA